MRAQPVMLQPLKTPDEVEAIRRVVHNAENIYGLLVSLDDKAAPSVPTSSKGASTTNASLRKSTRMWWNPSRTPTR